MSSSECTICMESFDEKKLRPRCLPCGHTFCTKCIDHSISIGNRACPTCRKDHKAPKASALPVNFLVEDFLKEKQSYLNTEKSDDSNKLQPKKAKSILSEVKKDTSKLPCIQKDETHYSTFCDCCYGSISGFRYKCLICDDYDLCKDCEKNIYHTEHPMLRIPNPQTKYDKAAKLDIQCSCSSYDPTFVHKSILCDCCEGSIIGYRYKCLNCQNFDLCHSCEHQQNHSHHLIVRLPTTIDSQIRYKRKRGADNYMDVGPARLSLQLYEECKVQ